MAKKVQITAKDDAGKETSFFSKTLTSLFNKSPAGTHFKLYLQENNFGKQYIGDLLTQAPPNEPEDPGHECPQGQHFDNNLKKCVDDIVNPPPIQHECPPNQHWDESLQKCIPDPIDHNCPAGQHWDEASQKCVDDTVTPPSGNELWNSNTHGKWNDGNKRVLTTKQGNQAGDDKSIFVAASGSPELIIDGDGVAHLHAGSGGVDNLSLKMRSRHQAGDPPENRAGGEGFAVDAKSWDSKRESYHNVHTDNGSGSLPGDISNGWHHITFTCKDVDYKESGGKGIQLIGIVDGKKVMDLVDKKAEPYFFDKALIMSKSWFWIRLNNSAHGRIYICACNYDATLDLDFMFEPAKSSIALKNVILTQA